MNFPERRNVSGFREDFMADFALLFRISKREVWTSWKLQRELLYAVYVANG